MNRTEEKYKIFLNTGHSFKIKGFLQTTVSGTVKIWEDVYMCNKLIAIIPPSATVVEIKKRRTFWSKWF